MRHHKKKKILGRKDAGERKALLRLLARSLILHGRITTTESRAKALRRFIEPLTTRAKEADLSDTRIIISRLGKADIAKKLIKDIAPKYGKRPGGYTRIVREARVYKDGRRSAIIEFV